MLRLPSRTLKTQLALAATALAVVAAAPPATGPMLLIPIGGDRAAAIRVATAHGARLLGPAPAGALLIWGDDRVFTPLARAGVLPLAAPFTACGSRPA